MKVQNPLIGRVKGSAGGMTGCKMFDKNVLKAKAFEVNNPNTPAQQTQRAFFKEVEGYANQLSEEEIKFLFPQKPKGMSRRSMLAKQLAEFNTTSDSVKSIDFANLVTLGNAPTAKLPELTIEWSETNESFKATWNDEDHYVSSHFYDSVFFIFINATKKRIKLIDPGLTFSDAAYNVPTEIASEETEELYAIMLNAGPNVENTGFGTLAVVNRPARKMSTQN